MQIAALVSLIILLIFLIRWVGPAVRRLPNEEKPAAKNPGNDVPPPTMMG